MSPVAQEIEDPSSQLILISKDSPTSTLSTSSTSMEDFSSAASMNTRDENFSMYDHAEQDSVFTIAKCLGRTSPSYPFIARRCDKSAIIRLSNELLKAKRSNWEVVDALGRAYQDMKDLRLREQRLNAIMSSCSKSGSNGFIEATPDSKIIELQLALRKEEVVKTRKNLRDLIDERDELKEKLDKTQSDMRLTSFAGERLERELESSQSHVKELNANIKEKDDRVIVAQNKLYSLENEMKVKDNELEKLREEKSILREAVIRSENEVEKLSERLKDAVHFQDEHASSPLSDIESRQQRFQTADPCKDYDENQKPLIAEKMKLVEELEYLEAKHNEDKRVIDDLSAQVQEWQSAVQSMNEYVTETNQRQLEARKEIADYVDTLERQLQEVKNAPYSSIKEEETEPEEQNYQDSSRHLKLNGSKDVEKSDKNQHSAKLRRLNESENINLENCYQFSTGLVKHGEVRMARVATMDDFVGSFVFSGSSKNTNSNDSKHLRKSPPRKTSSGGRRKLPEVARKTSASKCQSKIDDDQVTDSAVSQSDDASSVTSSETSRITCQASRDPPNVRRASRVESGRRLPTAPGSRETEVKQAVVSVSKSVTEPPRVNSIYQRRPSSLSNHRKDSGVGESVMNSPVLPDRSRKFSIRRSLRLKFGKEKSNSSDVQTVDVDDLPETPKGVFQRKLSILRGRKRRNSIGDSSSTTDSFRTVTPLGTPVSSDGEDLSKEGKGSGDEGRRRSSKKTSNPKKSMGKTSKGGSLRRPKTITSQRWKTCLLLIFQHLNPIELCSLARVCREWREISEHSSLWKHVILEGIPLNNIVLQAISRRCGCMQYLKFKGLKKIRTIEPHQSFAAQDKSCYLERGLEYLLKAAGSSLLSLHIEDCGVFVTDRCFTLAGCHCRELQSMVYISDSFPACPEALWALWACRKIVTLRVTPMFPCDHPARFNDKSLETIANCWPNLRHLSVGGPRLSPTGLIHIAKGCLRLQELELDRTISINEELTHAMCLCGLKGLETISFTFTPVSSGAIKQLLGACSRLECIEVHIGISDYFMDVEDSGNKRKYKRIVKKLTAMRTENLELARVLRIKADYG